MLAVFLKLLNGKFAYIAIKIAAIHNTDPFSQFN